MYFASVTSAFVFIFPFTSIEKFRAKIYDPENVYEICDIFHDSVPFVQLKNRKKHP